MASISIDRIPLPGDLTGKMWLCARRDIAPDAAAALGRVGAASVVCLLRAEELADYPDYVDWLRANEPERAIWYPISNYSAPTAAQLAPVADRVVQRLAAGEGVIVHCALGQGRAGTFAACVLVELGMTPDDAVRTVASHRVMAGPATAAQWALVEGIAAHVAGRRE